jgi:hypothetical protein
VPRTRASIVWAFAALASMPGSAADNSLGLAVFSTGTWTSYGRLHGFESAPLDGGLSRYEFNKILALGLYGKVLGLSAYAGLPLCWTSRRHEGGADEHRVAPGDLDLYLGKRLGRAELRLGGQFPAGYEGRASLPWIGPGNTQVTVAAAVNPNITRFSKRWEFSAEAEWAYAVSDGLAKAGSWGLFPSAKLSHRPMPEWRWGMECLGHWKASFWSRSATFPEAVLGQGNRRPDWQAGLVPIAFGEYFLRPRLALGLKAGHSLWGYRDALSYNGSVYLLYFP